VKKICLLLLWFGLVLALPAAEVADDVKAVLLTQQAAWNRGDIDGFMAGYVQSDDLRFASGGTITYGWKTTLERYKRHYPDRATMGTLAFSDLVVTVLAPDAALVFGKWELTRAQDKPSGLFTLTLRKTPAGWRIFQDHTSSNAEK
jgi:ketosteroid isomerase-like protein